MSWMKSLSFAFIVPVAFLVVACGDGNGNGADAGVTPDAGTDAGVSCASDQMVDLGGVVAFHPLVGLADQSPSLAGGTVLMGKASSALSGADPALKLADCSRAQAALAPDEPPITAPFLFEQVNTKPLALGLISIVDDAPDAQDGTLIPTAMGLAEPPVIEDMLEIRAFALNDTAEAALAQAVGMQPGTLLQAGFLLGMFMDAAGNPVDGVTLVDAASGTPQAAALYPTADLSGLETDGNTSANGMFVVTGVPLGNYGGQRDGWAFDSQQAASSAGLAFVMFLGGAEAP